MWRARILSTALLGLLSSVGSPQAIDRAEDMRRAWARAKAMHLADPHCIAYYTFEKDTFVEGKVRNLGEVGAALDAAIHGNARHAPQGGRLPDKGGMGWDGKTYLVVPDNPRLRPEAEGAIEFWIGPTKAVKGAGYCGMVENMVKVGEDYYGYGVTFCRYQNRPFWYAGDGKGELVWRRFGGTNSEGAWSHWIITWRNKDRRLDCYKNGRSVGTTGDRSAKRFAGVRYAQAEMPLVIAGAKTLARSDAHHPPAPGYLGALAIYGHFATTEKAKALYAASALPELRIDVTKWGARGNGATDDAPAIQRAIDAAESAGGGTVYLPPSDQPYLVGKTLRIDGHGVRLVGYGATIKLADHAGDKRVVDVIEVTGTADAPLRDVKILGLTIDGNYWAQTDARNPRCIDTDYAAGMVVRDVHVTRGFVCLSFGRGCSSCSAVDCTATRWHNDGFNASGDGVSAGCQAVSFINCHARDAANEADGGLPGRRNNAWEIEDGAQDIYVVDCSVENAGGNGFGIRNHAGFANEITQNIVLVNCSVRNVAGVAAYASSNTDTNVVRRVRLLNVRTNARLRFTNGVEDVIASGRFDAGIEIGTPGRNEPPTKVVLRNATASHVSVTGAGVTLANVTVVANGASGIEIHDRSRDVSIVNCTVVGATECGMRCSGASPRIVNTIVWGNKASLQLLANARPTIRHCCIQGGLPAGAEDQGGNVAADPRFADPSKGDFRLKPGSPCIGAGARLALHDGAARRLGNGKPNIGAAPRRR